MLPIKSIYSKKHRELSFTKSLSKNGIKDDTFTP